MTRLERRTRLLLRAYPAGYRRAHGEEIAGTLAEATPAGRDWPLPRESRALITAGLRARAAANGRLGTQAGLRLAALLGTAVYLAFSAGVSPPGKPAPAASPSPRKTPPGSAFTSTIRPPTRPSPPRTATSPDKR